MQKTPLGMDEGTWEQRNDEALWRQKYWKKGFKAGKQSGKSGESTENPYKLSSKIIELLRKRTLWFIGYEEGWCAGKAKREKKHHKHRDEQIKHIKEIVKKKHHKHRKHHHD